MKTKVITHRLLLPEDWSLLKREKKKESINFNKKQICIVTYNTVSNIRILTFEFFIFLGVIFHIYTYLKLLYESFYNLINSTNVAKFY